MCFAAIGTYGLREVVKRSLNAFMGKSFVFLNEQSGTNHIGVEDYCKPTR